MKTNMRKGLAVTVAVAMVFAASSAWAGEGWAGHKGEGEKGEHFEKMTKELNLTPQQKDELEKQRAATKPQMQALKERMRAAHLELKAELDKPTPDKARLAAIVTDLKNLTGEQIQMRIDKVLAMKKVLTSEQSAKMKSIMEKKKAEFKAKHGKKGEGHEGHGTEGTE